jgi:hypothetical protein
VKLLFALALVAACRDADPARPDSPPPIDAPPGDADKAKTCAATFGDDLAPGFQRFDGTIRAVVPPDYHGCPEPNSTHLVVQVDVNGTTYRMVVDVLSNQGSPDVWFDELDAALAGPAWAEGVHGQIPVDYPTLFSVASTDFTEMQEDPLVDKITSELALGAKISVFATVGDEMDSAHLVHRQPPNTDGAIVISPDTAPHWLLMHFDEQSF